MIGLTQIANYIPTRKESNLDKCDRFSIDENFLEKKLGVLQVSRKATDEDTSDLCVKAFDALKNKIADSPEHIDCLIVCTQSPDSYGIPHTSAIVHKKLNLNEDCACFDLSLGCSGYVYSLSVIKSFMESNGMKTGLLFTADPYSKWLDPDDKNTILLFGDAASVSLLQDIGECTSSWVPNYFRFATKGVDGEVLNNDDAKYFMNGRAVFNFAARQAPLQIKNVLEVGQKTQEDIDLFLLHQGSRIIVDTITKALRIPSDKVPFNIQNFGNTVSSSIPILFEEHLERDNISTVVMSGFGVGLSWASCLLEKRLP